MNKKKDLTEDKTSPFTYAFLIYLALSVSLTGFTLDTEMHFNNIFTENTMRVDSFHSGTSGEEKFAIDRILIEGPWAGRRNRLTDDLDLGKYRFRVRNEANGNLIYSSGYCSIFGEWETTSEAAAGIWKTFTEPFIFPEPRNPFYLSVEKRQQDGTFRELWQTGIDPGSRFVDRSPVKNELNVWTVFENGPNDSKVDLLILGDGYTADEISKFHSDVEKKTEILFSAAPFDKRKKDFNVRAIDIISQDRGISDPRSGVWKHTALGLTFNALDLDRYVLSFEGRSIRDMAAAAPYDFILILFNDSKYGGGGIFNLWLTCSSDDPRADYVFVHEFGHLFAGLADEYYSSDVAYENFESEPAEPWEPNVTALGDPAKLKWKNLVEKSTPLPTPWNKIEYDRVYSGQGNGETGSGGLSKDEKNSQLLSLVKNDTFSGKIGAFEGAAYHSTGMYRPELACTMFSTHTEEGFCRVCRQAIEKVIDLYTGKN
jgi:IgA Peptidase M64/Peptidase M64 N-terminus